MACSPSAEVLAVAAISDLIATVHSTLRERQACLIRLLLFRLSDTYTVAPLSLYSLI